MNKRKLEGTGDADGAGDGTVRPGHVPDWEKSELLDDACRLLREAAEYCKVTVDDSTVPPDTVPSKGHGFNARLRAELDIIVKARGATVGHGLTTQQSDIGTGLLDTLEEDWVDLTADGVEVDESTYDGGIQPYFLLQKLLGRAADVTNPRRRTWLLARLRIDQPAWKLQRRLLREVGNYAASIAAPLEIPSTPEWTDTKAIFDAMAAAHAALVAHWISVCKCDTCDHYNTKISLGRMSKTQSTEVTCTVVSSLCYGEAVYWKSVKVRWRSDGSRDTTVSRKRKVAFADEPVQSSAVRDVKVCELLRAGAPKSVVEILSGTLTTTAAMVGDAIETAGGNSHSPTLFSHWRTGDLPEKVLELKPRQRLSLALILAYAYLHLNGSMLWPRQQTSNEIWQHTNFSDARDLPRPLFSLTPMMCQSKHKSLASFINKSSPSLPILGTMLLALITGDKVSWDTYEDQIKAAKEEVFSKALIRAVETCLDAHELKQETETGPMSDRARDFFLQRVVLPLQNALVAAYEVNFDALFGSTDSGSINDKAKAALDPSVEMRKMPILQTQREHHTPGKTSQHPSDQWLTAVQRNLQPYFIPCYGDTRPVKIAVIDTGLRLSEDSYALYRDRIAECRSWVPATGTAPVSAEGRVFQADEDLDGHGTHITSTILDLTEEAESQLYVARVIRHRDEGGIMQEYIDDAIAKAIEHAVNVWGVSIISLSFGTSHAVPKIERAIETAQAKKVLIFASASNYGGNEGRSWPAERRDVLCVHASNAYGNPYERNPSAVADDSNFAVLGVDVLSEWLPHADGTTQMVRRTGTSFATPIAAGIAALILSLMHIWQEAYVTWRVDQAVRHRQKASPEKERQSYIDKVARLHSVHYMMRVFNLMRNSRAMYHYIVPEKLFKPAAPQDRILTIIKILDVLD